MRWLLALAALAFALALAWWLRAGVEELPPPVPVAAVSPAAAPELPDASSVAPRAASVEPVDAGAVEGSVEILVELLGERGHEAAQGLRFSTRYDGGHRIEGSLTTNVMGFGRVSLPPETYEVDPETEPGLVTITPETRQLTLRLAATPERRSISGVVTDEHDRPLESAEVLMREPYQRFAFRRLHAPMNAADSFCRP